MLRDRNIDYAVEGVPQENTIHAYCCDAVSPFYCCGNCDYYDDERQGRKRSKARMMNFGRSRARPSRDSKVNFSR